MVISPDLLKAKQALSDRFLRIETFAALGARGRMFRSRNIADAVAAAGHNVHAVGVGCKIVQGKRTETLCARLYVVQKLAPALLSPNNTLPTEINGLPTDVIESPFAFIGTDGGSQPSPVVTSTPTTPLAVCTVNRTHQQRPIVPGISTAHFKVTGGTIACFCRSKKTGDDPAAVYVLSNNHVFADVDQGMPGDNLLQPAPVDGGYGTVDAMANLDRFISIDMSNDAANMVNCALGKVVAGMEVTTQICTIGAITGTMEGQEQMRVRKHGRSTGYTEGEITTLAYDVMVGMDPSNPTALAKFVDQMRIDVISPYPAYSYGGDSGALVVDTASANAVGLHFAGPSDGSYGIANHIAHVLDALQIEIL